MKASQIPPSAGDELEHAAALQRQYPRLFKDKPAQLGVWYPRGWEQLMQRLCAGLDALLDDGQARRFRVDQVKAKFGTLRFYYSVGRQSRLNIDIGFPGGRQRFITSPKIAGGFPAQQVDALIRAAEADSAVTCSFCGAPGVLRQDVWVHVSCDACEALHTGAGEKGDKPLP